MAFRRAAGNRDYGAPNPIDLSSAVSSDMLDTDVDAMISSAKQAGYPREAFANSQLALVVAQVRFPALARFEDADARLRFQDALRREYPLFREERRLDLLFRGGYESPQTKPGDEVLRFSSIDRDWSLVLANDLVALECRRFSVIEEYLVHLRDVWRAVVAYFDPRYQLRASLRFVNELRNPKWLAYSEWRDVLNPALIGFDPATQFGGVVSHTISEFVLQINAEENLVMRRGFLRGTTIPPIDEKQRGNDGPFYLIDIEYASGRNGDFELDPSPRLATYNLAIHDVFRWSIERPDNDVLITYLRTPQ